FKNLKLTLLPKTENNPGIFIYYGSFLQTIINFLIIAFCLFLIIKVINQLKREEPTPPAPSVEPSNEEKLLTEIRDLLKFK
ncbi:MAG: MscL family protein, partial [Bacteroidia bacterium]|nr:MscL family protein [Bacteroidia bacterium]